MLGRCDVVPFVPTTNPERARLFYERTLGLRLVEDGPFALVFDANGVRLRVTKVESFVPAAYTVLGWVVRDILATVEALGRAGVVCERYPGLAQDDAGVWTSPSGARVAWFKDPDGNVLSLTQAED